MKRLLSKRRPRGLGLAFALMFVASTLAVAQKAAEEDKGRPEPFSEAVVQQLMATMRNGLVGHDAEKMLSAFGGMSENSQFAEQVRAFFGRYENFRVYYRVLEVAAVECAGSQNEGRACGRALIEMQLQGDDLQSAGSGVSRRGQLQVGFERLRNGWRINNIDREFFR